MTQVMAKPTMTAIIISKVLIGRYDCLSEAEVNTIVKTQSQTTTVMEMKG